MLWILCGFIIKGKGTSSAHIAPVLFSAPLLLEKVISVLVSGTVALLSSENQLKDVQLVLSNQSTVVFPCLISLSLVFIGASVLSFSNFFKAVSGLATSGLCGRVILCLAKWPYVRYVNFLFHFMGAKGSERAGSL